jgi:hypothetical protein
VPAMAGDLTPHPSLTLKRTPPAQPIPTVGLVTVDLTATFAAGELDGCFEVVELVPSGLAPLAIGAAESDESGIIWPSSVVGQEVRFCAFDSAEGGHSAHLRYVARVVNAGTFAWESAVMQFSGAPELVAITPAGTVTIAAR